MKIFLFLCNLGLLFLALGVEIYALTIVMDESVSNTNLIKALIFHFVASTVSACMIAMLLTSNFIESRLELAFFFFVITFYLPVLGLSGLILAILIIMIKRRYSRPERSNFPVNLNKIRRFPAIKTSIPNVQPKNNINIFGLYKSRNPDKRLAAVFATLKLKDQDAVPLLRMALGDTVDDIRLLAYALLDRKEHKITERIRKAKQSIGALKEFGSKQLYRQIANDYWELVRLGLVQGETRNYVLNTACKFIEIGLIHHPRDAGLCYQYALILLKLGLYQQSYEQFKKAENLGIEHKNLLAYYAEIAFYGHRYKEVKQLMKAVDLPVAYPQLSMAARFWQKGA